MILKDISLSTPQENILLDDALLKLAELDKQGEVLRFWESDQVFVVLGRVCKLKEDVQLDHVKNDSIEVLRRSSGGGTVLQGKGCLNFSLILSKEKSPEVAELHKSYQFILEKIISALGTLGIEAEFQPISDIALKDNQKKISGNAQKRSRKYILHHGTILYDFDLSLISRYLKMPQSIPDYRQERNHDDFVTNISASRDDLKKAISSQFSVTQSEDLSEQEYQLLDDLKHEAKAVDCS